MLHMHSQACQVWKVQKQFFLVSKETRKWSKKCTAWKQKKQVESGNNNYPKTNLRTINGS